MTKKTIAQNWKVLSDENVERIYYEVYPGLVKHELLDKDLKFYSLLYRRELLDKLMPGSKSESYKGWVIRDYKIATKAAIGFFKEEKIPFFRRDYQAWNYYVYNEIRKEGLLYRFFPKIQHPGTRSAFEGKSIAFLSNHHRENHKGKERRKIKKDEPDFYDYVMRKVLKKHRNRILLKPGKRGPPKGYLENKVVSQSTRKGCFPSFLNFLVRKRI